MAVLSLTQRRKDAKTLSTFATRRLCQKFGSKVNKTTILTALIAQPSLCRKAAPVIKHLAISPIRGSMSPPKFWGTVRT